MPLRNQEKSHLKLTHLCCRDEEVASLHRLIADLRRQLAAMRQEMERMRQEKQEKQAQQARNGEVRICFVERQWVTPDGVRKQCTTM